MRYISIDIETTGLNPETCDIIEFAAVIDNLITQEPIESLPYYHAYVLRDSYRGEAYAFGMHGEIFKKIAAWREAKMSMCKPENLMANLMTFLTTKGGYTYPIKINVAGKNFANFDNRFLSKLPEYDKIKISHRILDPAMLYFDPQLDAAQLPSTEQCLRRAGLTDTITHTALDDARLVIKLLRNKFPQLPPTIDLNEIKINKGINMKVEGSVL